MGGAPEIGRQTRPVLPCERAEAQARVAGNRIGCIDTPQDRVTQLGQGELLHDADEFFRADAFTQRIATHVRHPGNVPQSGGRETLSPRACHRG